VVVVCRRARGGRVKAIELFAGAGGAALGLEAAGVHHLALCEWDPDACATLRAAGRGPVVEGDVRDLDAIAAVAGESCDLLWSSFPCQAFSTAGKRLGARDGRNGWPWTVDAIDRFKPRWFLAENVRGLLCHRGDCDRRGPPEDCSGCYFERVILVELRQRFPVVGWWLLDAADYGIPQHRRRVIIHAGPEPVTPPRATHGPGMFTRPWVSMGEALGLDSGVLPAGRNTAANPNQERPVPSSEPAPAIGGKGNQMWSTTVCTFGGSAKGTRVDRRLSESAGTIDTKATAYFRMPAPTVTAQEHKGTRCSARSGWTFSGGPDRASDALAMATGYRGSNRGRRRLTVAECATLQGFPDDYPWHACRTKTAQYRAVGNAVPPRLAQVVAESVLAADRTGQTADREKPHHHGILSRIVENADE